MAKRPSSRRPGDSRSSEPDDVFVAKIVEWSTWAKNNSQTLVLGGVAVALVVAGIMYWIDFQNTQETQAVQQLEAVQQTLAFGDRESARAELNTFLERFEGTDVGDEARLLLAQLHIEDDQAAQAISLLQQGPSSLGAPLGHSTQELLAKAHEANGALAEAEIIYMRLAEGAELEFQRIAAMDDAARVRSLQEDYAGAADLYEELLEVVEPTDPDRGVYEMRLAEARVRAGTGT